MRHILCIIITFCAIALPGLSQTTVTINDPQQWTYAELKPYVGQTIRFATPMYVTNNYNSGSLTIAPRLIFTPTNQVYPMSQEYNALLIANAMGLLWEGTRDAYGNVQIMGLVYKIKQSKKSVQIAEAVVEELRPLQEEYHRLVKDKAYLEGIMKDGAEKASYLARKTLSKVYKNQAILRDTTCDHHIPFLATEDIPNQKIHFFASIQLSSELNALAYTRDHSSQHSNQEVQEQLRDHHKVHHK